jgi:general secretion pathway protein A
MTSIYTEYFGFAEPPFSLAPDPRYLYASEQHREALAHLLYGVRGEGGFVLLTGEVGTGKTTVFRCLLERLPEKTKIAFVLHPRLSVTELLATVCDEFGITYPKGEVSTKTFVDLLNGWLLEITGNGYHAVLVIDEAQNLSLEVLEQLRLLTNLETNRRKLLQIILLGQPELREMLSVPAMSQLSQRITARYHLEPLARSDTGPYIDHRLAVAGVERPLFPGWAVGLIYRWSGGVPRVINLICDRALLGTYTRGKADVTREILRQAADEVLGTGRAKRGRSRRVSLAAAGAVLASALLLLQVKREDAEVREAQVAESVDGRGEEKSAAPLPVKLREGESESPGEERHEPAVMSRDLEWLFGRTREGSWAHAAGVLFSAWGLPPPSGTGERGVCSEARSQGLRCLSGEGGLEDLRRMNLPALLRLLDEDGKEFYAALTGAEEDRVTLTFKGGSGQVEFRWFGSYTLLWKPPPGYGKPVRPGERSPVVRWVREGLGAAVPQGVKGAEDRYDAALVEAVRSFQRSRGLEADGIVGPRTLIAVGGEVRGGNPFLARAGEGS